MTNTVQYRGNQGANDPELTDRLPSPHIWGDCPLTGIQFGTVNGITFFDDFTDFPLPGTQTTEIALGRYKVYCATAGVWQYDDMPHTATPAGGMGGIVSVLCDSDEDSAVLAVQDCPFSLDTTQANGKLWFEARIATTSILTATTNFFVGLAENGVATYAATNPMDDDDALTGTVAMIGWRRAIAGLATLDTVYSDHAVTFTNILAAANASPLTQLKANTFIKLGFKFDPNNSAACVQFYVNGIEAPTPLTKAALLALTHVDVKGLAPCLAVSAGASGTAAYTYIDWWKCSQVY